MNIYIKFRSAVHNGFCRPAHLMMEALNGDVTNVWIVFYILHPFQREMFRLPSPEALGGQSPCSDNAGASLVEAKSSA